MNQGRLCSRCLALTQYLYHEDRSTQPSKHVGERGENKWQPLFSEEAFTYIEKNMKDIRRVDRAESMVSCRVRCLSFGPLEEISGQTPKDRKALLWTR